MEYLRTSEDLLLIGFRLVRSSTVVPLESLEVMVAISLGLAAL